MGYTFINILTTTQWINHMYHKLNRKPIQNIKTILIYDLYHILIKPIIDNPYIVDKSPEAISELLEIDQNIIYAIIEDNVKNITLNDMLLVVIDKGLNIRVTET